MSSICHTIKIEKINLFGISSFISWAKTFKNREFRQKIENFHHHFKFFMMFILRNNNYYLSCHSIEIKILNFWGFRHLFRGLTPSKIENFEQKLKTSTTTPNFS